VPAGDEDQTLRVSAPGHQTRTVVLAAGRETLDIALTTSNAIAPSAVTEEVLRDLAVEAAEEARRRAREPHGGAEAPDVFDVAEVQPELIGGIEGLKQRINYPELQRRAGVEGQAIVQFVVDTDGSVTNAELVRSAGNDGLDRAALEAVEGSRFRPGRQQGEPVKVRFLLPVRFALPADGDDDDQGQARPIETP
jgi:TonB family protein